MVDPRAWTGGGEHAKRDRDHDRNNQAEQRQLGGRRQAVADFSRHRLAGGERIAEIAMRKIRAVAEELLDQRLVEAEFLADLFDRLLIRRGSGEIRRGIAGQRARQQEGDDDDPDQARDRKHQPFADHGQHDARLSVCHDRANSEWRIANRRWWPPAFTIRYSLFAIPAYAFTSAR